MIRIPTLAVALAVLPLGAAMAQTQTGSPTCGPETWSTSQMAYVAQPCNGPAGQTAQASSPTCGPESWSTSQMAYVSQNCGTVGAAGPTLAPNSTTMTKAEMKGGYGSYAAMPVQAAAPGPYASTGDCGPTNVVAITDEYHRTYNCRGDRIR